MKTLDARRVVPVFFVTLLVTAAVVIIDLMLVDVARQHRSDAALQMFERGQSEMRQGNTAAALELFRSAHNQSTSNSEYHLAFARGLRANGLEREGQAAVERLLSQLPSHGGANAEMARILAHAGDWERAAWFYHRSLYGEWRGSPDLVSLRFELADLLAKHGADGELLAEVVLLETLSGPSLDRRHLAKLLLAAKAWTRAERQYQMLLRSSPAEAELLAGLARAQFGAG
ncbi:MAG: tetratricopeptide repeat protein, partial [Anaerolineae bacterium]|nr:tetratricopeptide repeat protein [Gemmatimonadaceae bacterium]